MVLSPPSSVTLCDSHRPSDDSCVRTGFLPVCRLGLEAQNANREIELDGKPFRLKKAYSFLVKYLAPISIIIIIVASFATGTTLS